MANDLTDIVEIMTSLPEETHYLYKITNLVNGKTYVGVTKNLKHRMNCHIKYRGDRLVNKAVKKYGKDNFKFEVLCAGSEDYIYGIESSAIKLYNSDATNGWGYNLCFGGKGGKGGKRQPILSRSDDTFKFVSGFWFPNKRTALKALNWGNGLYASRKSRGTLGNVVVIPEKRGPQYPVYVSGFWFPSKKQAMISLRWGNSKYNHRLRNNQLGNLTMNRNLKGNTNGQ